MGRNAEIGLRPGRMRKKERGRKREKGAALAAASTISAPHNTDTSPGRPPVCFKRGVPSSKLACPRSTASAKSFLWTSARHPALLSVRGSAERRGRSTVAGERGE